MSWKLHDGLTDNVVSGGEADTDTLTIAYGGRTVLAVEHVEKRTDDAELLSDLTLFLDDDPGAPLRERETGTGPCVTAALSPVEAEEADRVGDDEVLHVVLGPGAVVHVLETEDGTPSGVPVRETILGDGAQEYERDRQARVGAPLRVVELAESEQGTAAHQTGEGVDLAVATGAIAPGEDRARTAELRTGDPDPASQSYATSATNGCVRPAPATPTAPAREPWRPASFTAPKPERTVTDAEIRRWCRKHAIPVSAQGAIRTWVREAFHRVSGGEPDQEARVAASHEPPKATHAAAGTTPATASTDRARPEQLDEARRLLAQGYGPVHVADATAVALDEVKELAATSGIDTSEEART